MVKQRIFLQSAIGLSFGLSLLCPAFVMASSDVLDEGLAQGDGDPAEDVLVETAIEAEPADADEDVATITAEGDFLVPTYLLPVAEEEAQVVSQTDNNVSVKKTITTTTTTTTKEVPVYVVSASSSKTVSTDSAVSSKEGKSTSVMDVHTQVAEKSKMASEVGKTELSNQGNGQKKAPVITHNIGAGYNAPKPLVQNGVKSATLSEPTLPSVPSVPSVSGSVQTVQARPVLVPLAPLPKMAEPEPVVEPHVRKIVPSQYADKMLTALEDNKRPDFIMPQEIKVSFYKNASHFSGQTIKWIKAFSVSAMNDPRLIVEVRLSTQNPSVQQKRLSIIQNTLIGNGLSPHQIRVIFTNRPADSLILRTMPKPELAQVSVSDAKKRQRGEKRTTRW